MIKGWSRAGVMLALAISVSSVGAAHALGIADTLCRKSLGQGVRGLQKTALNEQVKCFDRTMKGQLSGVNCADTNDPAFPGATKIQSKRLKLTKLAQAKCITASTPQQNGFVFCPSPCSSNAITDYQSVAGCLQCLAEYRSGVANVEAYGSVPVTVSADQIKCQTAIGKALTKYADARTKAQQKCQYLEDKAPTGTNCQVDDSVGAIAKAVGKLRASLIACNSALLATLDSCGANLTAEQSCLEATGNVLTNDTFKDVYDPEGFNGIFVSATLGAPGGTGAIDDPLDTIGNGMAVANASGKANVFVDGGAYIETLSLISNLNVLGGFNSSLGWPRDGTTTSVFGGTTAVFASGRSNVTLDGLRIFASSNGAVGGSSYGVRLIGSTGIVIRGSTITAGNAGPGSNGGSGANGFGGGGAGNGGGGCEDSSIFCSGCSRPGGGPGGFGVSCYGSTGGNGAGGGQPGHECSSGDGGGTGGSGFPGGVPGGGGGFGGGGCSFGNGGVGHPGNPGNAGSNGGAGGSFGSATSAYSPANGGGGSVGSGGGGGGGGGAGGGGDDGCDSWGGGGGGGGGGGCGGQGASGGTGAGGSFGVWVNGGNVTVASTTITTGNGGNGGAGGTGGNGGGGGPAGVGGGGEDDSGAGNTGGGGGNGGRGGHGGGGGGGPSVGIVCTSPGSLASTANTFTLGTAGSGGSSPGNAGAAGLRTNQSGC